MSSFFLISFWFLLSSLSFFLCLFLVTFPEVYDFRDTNTNPFEATEKTDPQNKSGSAVSTLVRIASLKSEL